MPLIEGVSPHEVLQEATGAVSEATTESLPCIACYVVEPIERIAENFSKNMFVELAPLAYGIFKIFVTFWILLTIGQALTKQLNNPEKIWDKGKQLFMFTIIVMLLGHQAWVWELFYDPLKQFFEEMIKFVLSLNLRSLDIDFAFSENQKGYLMAIDGILQEMYGLAASMMSGNPVWALVKIMVGGIIFLVYGLVCFIAIFFVVELMYTVTIISSFTPLLLIAAGFKPTRGNAKRAVQILLNNILTVLFSMIGVSILLAVYNELFSGIAPDGSVKSVEKWAWGSHWLALVLVGGVALVQQKKSKDLANNLSGVSEGMGITAVAAGITTTAFGLVAMGGKGLVVAGVGKGLEKMGLKALSSSIGAQISDSPLSSSSSGEAGASSIGSAITDSAPPSSAGSSTNTN